MVSATTKDSAAGKNLKTQRGWLFVSLERWIDGALELAQEIKTKELKRLKLKSTASKADSVAKNERRQK
jgi:hypothetical protein